MEAQSIVHCSFVICHLSLKKCSSTNDKCKMNNALCLCDYLKYWYADFE
jgi:hypothetical protein